MALAIAVSFHAHGQGCSQEPSSARGSRIAGTFALQSDDVNGDGVVDLVSSTTGDLSTSLGNGDGTFRPGTTTPLGRRLEALDVGKLDPGPTPDVVIVGDDSFGIALGDGGGGFLPIVWHPAENPGDVMVADMDGDFDLDIVATNPYRDSVSVYRNNGDGSFLAGQHTPAGSRPFRPAAGDVDRDGDLDLLVLRDGEPELAVLKNNGDATLQPPSNVPTGAAARGISLADVNGDGRVDVALAAYGSDQIVLLLGDGFGTFGPPILLAAPGGPTDVAAADVGGDGAPDLVIALREDDSVGLLTGHGDGAFDPLVLATVGGSPSRVAVADADQDGIDDAIAACEGSATAAVARGKGDGSFTATARTDLPFSIHHAVAGDVDGDGLGDMVAMVSSGSAADVVSMLGRGDGGFRIGPGSDLVGPSALFHAAALVDLDVDGDLDLVVGDRYGGLELFGGRGDGGFIHEDSNGDFATAEYFTAAWLDADAVPDLVGNGSSGVTALLGNGDGTFGAPVASAAGVFAIAFAAGDLDHDGFDDVVAGRQLEEDVVVLLGRGDGRFDVGQTIWLGEAPAVLVLGDLDLDGSLDLVVGGGASGGSVLYVLLGQGDGQLRSPILHVAVAEQLAIADLSRDGVPDVVALNAAGIEVLEGNGDGSLGAAIIHSVGSAEVMGVLDLDGDLVADTFGATGYRIDAVVRRSIAVSPATLPPGVQGAPYTATLTASGGVPPYAFSATAPLPPGLALGPSGTISGTPLEPGLFSIALMVRDSAGCEARRSYELTVAGFPAYLSGQGHGAPNPNRVVVHDLSGAPTGVDFLAYGAGQWGVNVGTADLDGAGREEILTGPGPGPVYGPQVRGFLRDGTSMTKVNFFAYGTLRYGVNVAGDGIDGDPYGEILTAPGPGEIFGPHVRAFDVDASVARPIAKVSFFAYATLRYGANVAGRDVDVDGDGFAEILTGAGAGDIFPSHVRGFDYDGITVSAIPKLSFVAFAHQGFGAVVAGGDVDLDGDDEIGVAPGPGPLHPAELQAFDDDGAAVVAIPGYAVTIPGTYGLRIALGDVGDDLADDVIVGAGPDPAEAWGVVSYSWNGRTLTHLESFHPFASGYGVNVAAGAIAP